MNKLLHLIPIIIFILGTFTVNAQQVVPNNSGFVRGLLQDTIHKYTVKSATISIYRADSTLLNYQLSNNYGEFSFKNLPLATKYYIEVSHISYQILRQSFELTGKQNTIDLKVLILKPKEVQLKEVQIRIPPIQMNGDTLEFNAAAFKLDSNAVVEDLLRKIPNVTLWGDGQITVNGREVKSLLVNGKEFFGGDFKIALQNIPKNALEKVQVYNTNNNENNPLDSMLTVNLKLKKGKDTGYFGKFGGGYGTTNRFEADGNINIFIPKLQVSIVSASNNVNKIANNLKTLTSNNTFKGSDLNVEYQPDFSVNGISRTNVGGVTLSYNFIEPPTHETKSTFTANYFVQNRNNDVILTSQTVTAITEGNKIFDNTSTNSNSLSTNQSFDSRFEYAKQSHRLEITQSFSVNTNKSNNSSLRSTSNQEHELTSTNNTVGQNKYNNKTFRFNVDYNYNRSLNYKNKIRSFNVRYSLKINDNNGERENLTSLRSFVDSTSNRDYNRKYNTNGNNLNQHLYAELTELQKILFGYKRLVNTNFNISNDLKIQNYDSKNQVSDLNSLINNYTTNTYLSNNVHINTIKETPALNLTQSYTKNISNRFNRNVSLNLSLRQQFSYQDNRSVKLFQNITRKYSNFVPQVSVSYYRSQYGEYSNNITFNFETNVTIPTMDQLAPLTDSSNIYLQQRGNINLREAKARDINIYFSHIDQHSKNTLNYNFNASLTFIENSFSDSTFIDNQNRRTIYLINANGSRSARISADFKKALKLKIATLQFSFGGAISFDKNPGYVNEAFSFSHGKNSNTYVSMNYTYREKLAFEAKENLSFFNSNAYNTNYSGSNITSAFSSRYKVTKKFSINSNISLNSSKASAGKTMNYNIWNASAAYRFLKGNTAEFKFTALDLLHQNNNIINTGSANSFTFVNRNVLRQYFIITFSYYPRQFGKKVPPTPHKVRH